MQSNYMVSGDPLSLDRIRSVLTRLEDTIIFGLIERAQFAHNPRIYQKGAFEELRGLDFKGSWLDWFLSEIEGFHGTFVQMLDPPTDSRHMFCWFSPFPLLTPFPWTW
jgi:chorismate mutase